jgi:hypothetical protein
MPVPIKVVLAAAAAAVLYAGLHKPLSRSKHIDSSALLLLLLLPCVLLAATGVCHAHACGHADDLAASDFGGHAHLG